MAALYRTEQARQRLVPAISDVDAELHATENDPDGQNDPQQDQKSSSLRADHGKNWCHR